MTEKHTAGRAYPDRLPIAEYAPYCGVSVPTAYTWRYRGLGPKSYRIGNKVYADRVDLDQWLAEQKASTASA
ncbi:helix-turn-helix transcriptional regulator [Nocardia aurea]|uniref:helix-turn-helix transcriptional regulator n=1 Tax=Nocardia aurea TaxID=2144174 RepID=UPI0033BF1D6D